MEGKRKVVCPTGRISGGFRGGASGELRDSSPRSGGKLFREDLGRTTKKKWLPKSFLGLPLILSEGPSPKGWSHAGNCAETTSGSSRVRYGVATRVLFGTYPEPTWELPEPSRNLPEGAEILPGNYPGHQATSVYATKNDGHDLRILFATSSCNNCQIRSGVGGLSI